jgi:hypothetical protein
MKKRDILIFLVAAIFLAALGEPVWAAEKKHQLFAVYNSGELTIKVSSTICGRNLSLNAEDTWSTIFAQYARAGGEIPSFKPDKAGTGLFFLPCNICNRSDKPFSIAGVVIRTTDGMTYRNKSCNLPNIHFQVPFTAKPGECNEKARALVYEVPFGQEIWWPDITGISFFGGGKEYPLILLNANAKLAQKTSDARR